MNILCFGDSNTWGHNPASPGIRFDCNQRWTSLLAKYLGQNFHIYEEGLCGRTTVFEDPFDDGLCGNDFLSVCLRTTMPLDLVIIMLGTNDLKHFFHVTAEEIARGIERLIKIVKAQSPDNQSTPKILVVSPILIAESIITSPFCEMFGGIEARKTSMQLAEKYKSVCKQYDCYFLNAADFAQASDDDAIHLDERGHKSLALALKDKILEIQHDLDK